MTRTRWRGLLAVVFTSLAVLAAGCDDDDDTTTPPDQGPTTQLRIIHASPDAPAVDIYLQGRFEPLAVNVMYTTVSPYITVPAGEAVFEIRAAGAPSDSPPVYTTGPLTLAPDTRVTAVAAGLLRRQEEDTSFRILPLVEEFAQVTPATARVRIVHAGVDVPAVGLDVGNDGSIEVERLERFAETGSVGIPLPTGASLQVGLVTGTPAERLTAFTLPPLQAGAEIFIVATGLINQPPRDADAFALITTAREGPSGFIRQNPVVYALHASPDAPEVDIFVAGNELVDDLTFGELSARIQVPPGAYTLDFFRHESGRARPVGTPVVTRQTPTLEAGQRYLVVASGFLDPRDGGDGQGAAQQFTLISLPEGFANETEDDVRIRLVHASPDAPPVDVGVLTGQGLVPQDAPFQDVAFTQASAPMGVVLPAREVTLGVTAANSLAREPVATFSLDLSPLRGGNFFAVAAGALLPREDEEGLRLLLVNTSRNPWTLQDVSPR